MFVLIKNTKRILFTLCHKPKRNSIQRTISKPFFREVKPFVGLTRFQVQDKLFLLGQWPPSRCAVSLESADDIHCCWPVTAQSQSAELSLVVSWLPCNGQATLLHRSLSLALLCPLRWRVTNPRTSWNHTIPFVFRPSMGRYNTIKAFSCIVYLGTRIGRFYFSKEWNVGVLVSLGAFKVNINS